MTKLPWPKKAFKPVKHTLFENTVFEQWIIPKGTEVTLLTFINFGICVIPRGTKDVRGFVIPIRIFKY